MKIIKDGVIPAPVEYTGRCSNCKCEFECTESDFVYPKYEEWTNANNRMGNLPHVKCPTCTRPIPTCNLSQK